MCEEEKAEEGGGGGYQDKEVDLRTCHDDVVVF